MRSYRKHDRDRVYDFIVAWKKAHDGNSPSIRQLTDECNTGSTSVTAHILEKLESEGRIKVEDRQARQIVVIGGEWRMAA